jgi:hypothetical protein
VAFSSALWEGVNEASIGTLLGAQGMKVSTRLNEFSDCSCARSLLIHSSVNVEKKEDQ